LVGTSRTVNPELIAFAGYDYTLTQGGLGQYTTLIKGSESLFNETQSGLDISGLVGDWNWVAGVGWEGALPPDSIFEFLEIPFIIANGRVVTNVKRVKRLLDIDVPDDYDLIGCSVTTENPEDLTTNLTCGLNREKRQLDLSVVIIPQPKQVNIKVKFRRRIQPLENFINTSQTKPILLKYDKFFDQCEPIPEPTSTLSFLALGTLGAASTLKRKLKPSKSTKKETTKVG
jgi:hypothetical protein